MKKITNRNIIIFSSVDWDTHKQLHHELTNFLIKRKNRILFVENTGSRNFKIKDLSRVKNRVKNFFKSKRGFRIFNKNLVIFSPLFIPFHYNFLIQKINNFLISSSIKSWVKDFNFYNTIVINFVPNPITFSATKNLNPNIKVYYMADDMSSNDKKRINIERKIMNISDIIFFTSNNLKKKLTNLEKSEFLPNGVNLEIFNKKFVRKNSIKKKIVNIGYVGAIRDIINENLIIKLAKKIPKDKIFLLGPVLHKFKKLNKFENIIFLGEKKHYEIPNYLKKFDIGIIPYKINNFTNSINPLKVYEYISAGLPTVSTNLKGIQFLKKKKTSYLYSCKTDKIFINEVLKLKNNYQSIDKKEANKFLRENSWKNRFEFFEKKVLEKEYLSLNSKKNFFEKFYWFYNSNKIQTFKYSLISIFIAIFLFNTQISNFLFEKYSVKFSKVDNNEMVVVFTGFGSKNYSNVDYLNRSKDLIYYYQKYHFENIIIVGRSSKFDEGELVKDIFKNKFNEELILIKDSGSTYKNVIKLNKLLIEQFPTINKFNIISSPIITRRLDLVLAKNTNSEFSFLKPSISYIEEKKLNYFSFFYELFSLVYYKFKKFI